MYTAARATHTNARTRAPPRAPIPRSPSLGTNVCSYACESRGRQRFTCRQPAALFGYEMGPQGTFCLPTTGVLIDPCTGETCGAPRRVPPLPHTPAGKDRWVKSKRSRCRETYYAGKVATPRPQDICYCGPHSPSAPLLTPPLPRQALNCTLNEWTLTDDE